MEERDRDRALTIRASRAPADRLTVRPLDRALDLVGHVQVERAGMHLVSVVQRDGLT